MARVIRCTLLGGSAVITQARGAISSELSARAEHVEPLCVRERRRVAVRTTELDAVFVAVEAGKPGLRGAKGQLPAAELDPRGQDRVLELVLALGELSGHKSAL